MSISTVTDAEVLTIEEAAAVLRIGRNAAYALARQWRSTGGQEGLPCIELGRTLRVPRRALQQLLATTPTTMDQTGARPRRLSRDALVRRRVRRILATPGLSVDVRLRPVRTLGVLLSTLPWRTRMRGHVAKKGNRYYAVVYEGTDPGTGKNKYKWVAAGTRRSDAESLVNELVGRRLRGEEVGSDRSTLGAYLTDRWLPLQESRLRPSTFNSYRATIELHVLPYIGKLRLDKLQADDLEGLYVQLLRSGLRRGKNGRRAERDLRPLRPPRAEQGAWRRTPEGHSHSKRRHARRRTPSARRLGPGLASRSGTPLNSVGS